MLEESAVEMGVRSLQCRLIVPVGLSSPLGE